MSLITINNVTKVANGQYSVVFLADFTPSELFYELSSDGLNWNAPVQITDLVSPVLINTPNMINFYIRLKANDAPLRIHTSVYSSVYN